MATSAILNFINTTKASTHDGEIPTMFHEVWRKKSKKFVLPIPIFLAYLVSLDVDVTGNITAKICEVWSEFNIFYTLVTMATAATTVDIATKFHEVRLNETPKKLYPPFLFPWHLWQSLSNRFRFFWLVSFHQMWMLFLSSSINFCSASNLLW